MTEKRDVTALTFPSWGESTRPQSDSIEVDGCAECNRQEPKPWPVFTVNYHGVEVCAKCLTRMDVPRRKRG